MVIWVVDPIQYVGNKKRYPPKARIMKTLWMRPYKINRNMFR